MGARLVAATYAYWSHLPDRPFRALVYMALVSRDDDKHPLFFGGRGSIAVALGGRDDESGRQSVKRCMRALVEAGAVTRHYTGHAGKRSEYRINVKKGPVDIPVDGVDSPGERGSVDDPQRGSLSDPKGGHSVNVLGVTQRPPKEPRGTTEEHNRKNYSSTEGDSRGAVDKSRSAEKRLQQIRDRCDAEGRASA